MSVDVRNCDQLYNYIAVIDRQGLLTIYEPTTIDDFREWRPADQFNVRVPLPSRGDETCFKVRWDKNPMPLPHYNSIIDDQQMLSLVVTSINDVIVYSTVPLDTDSDDDARPLTFYESGRLPTHPALVRDVKWNGLNIRGVDWIATACKDGSVRVYELDAIKATDANGRNAARAQSSSQTTRPQPQSSLTTAIVGRRGADQDQSTSNADAGSARGPGRSTYPFPFRYNVREEAVLEGAHSESWQLDWDPSGQVLMSGGSDGVVKLWRKSIDHGEWLLCHEMTATEEDEAEAGGTGDE